MKFQPGITLGKPEIVLADLVNIPLWRLYSVLSDTDFYVSPTACRIIVFSYISTCELTTVTITHTTS